MKRYLIQTTNEISELISSKKGINFIPVLMIALGFRRYANLNNIQQKPSYTGRPHVCYANNVELDS